MAKSGTKGTPQTLVPAPPKKKGTKGTPEKIPTTDNLQRASPEDLVPFNFQVTAEFRKDFKLEAAEKEISQKELLMKMREFWNEHHK